MAVKEVLERGYTQEQIAKVTHVSRSTVAMAATGRRKMPKETLPKLSRMCYKAALSIANEQTGGYISNLFETYPDIDLHPAALKERVLIEIDEAKTALEALRMSKMAPDQKRDRVKDVLMELEDVSELIDGLKGAFAEEFDIDLMELMKKRREMIRRGERL